MSATIRRRRLIALGIIAVGILLLAVLYIRKPRTQRLKPQIPAPMVTVHTVTADQPPVIIQGWGTVVPKRSIAIVTQVTGRVIRVSDQLQAGAFVAAGSVLVEIEDTDYVLAVQQASSQVAQAELNLATAREESRIARQEWENTLADAREGSALAGSEPSALVFREPQLRQAEVGLEAARAALAQAELNLSRCRLTAPFTGRVREEAVDPGQFVTTGAVLGRLDDTSVAEVTISLPDADLAWVDVPQTATDESAGSPVTIRGEFAGATHEWSGRVVRLGGAIDTASRAVPVVVEVPRPYDTDAGRPPLMSGMFVSIDFAGPAPAGSVTVPRRGLRPGDAVWVLDGEDRLRVRAVEVARSGEETVVITSGLAPGERLITSNLQYVVDGMQLRAQGAVEGGTRP